MKLLKDLINRGFLRIFPFPQKVIVGLTLIGCGSTKQVTLLVTDIRHDTIYVSNNQFDVFMCTRTNLSTAHVTPSTSVTRASSSAIAN